MFRIVEFEKRKGYGVIVIGNHPEYGRLPVLFQDGFIEAYMGSYGIDAAEAVMLVLTDTLIDGVEAPFMDDPDIPGRLAAIREAAKGQFRWEVDKNEALATITLAEDDAADCVNLWASYAEKVQTEEAQTAEEVRANHRASKEEFAAGYAKREEELLAEEFVSSMDRSLLTAPRGDDSVETPAPAVGLAIQFVP